MDDPSPEAAVVASTPPVGVSSRQIFAVGMMLLGIYVLVGVVVMLRGDAAERTGFEQSAIQLATMSAAFYLGSSAGSRNKEARS